MVEPASLMLALGAGVVYASHRMERLSEKFGAEPRTLPGLLCNANVEDYKHVQVLAVHVHKAALVPELAGQLLSVQVKYGTCGGSIRGRSLEDLATEQEAGLGFAHANFGSSLLFLRHKVANPTIKISLKRKGRFGSRTVGQALLHIHLSQCLGSQNVKLTSIGRRARDVGALQLSLETFRVTKAALQRTVELVGANAQKQTLIVTRAAAIAAGCMVEESNLFDDDSTEEGSFSDEESIFVGEPITDTLPSAWRHAPERSHPAWSATWRRA